MSEFKVPAELVLYGDSEGELSHDFFLGSGNCHQTSAFLILQLHPSNLCLHHQMVLPWVPVSSGGLKTIAKSFTCG